MCRDCGGPRDQEGAYGMRGDICKRCMRLRLVVIRAVESKEITHEEFKKYQKPGMRTKRLMKFLPQLVERANQEALSQEGSV